MWSQSRSRPDQTGLKNHNVLTSVSGKDAQEQTRILGTEFNALNHMKNKKVDTHNSKTTHNKASKANPRM